MSTFSRRARLACMLLVSAFLAPAVATVSHVRSPRVAFADGDGRGDTFDALGPELRRKLDSDKVEDRLKVFARAATLKDPRALDLVLDGLTKEAARRAALARSQAETETALEAVVSEVERTSKETPKSAAALDEFNARVRKLESKRDAIYTKSRRLATEQIQEKAVFVQAAAAAGSVIDGLPPDVARPLLDQLTAKWHGPKATVEERVRWVDVIAMVRSVPTGPLLRAVALDASLNVQERVAATAARASRLDEGVVTDCVALLSEIGDRWPVAATAIDTLRRLHKREAIEPLIAYLGRNDIGRLREDAHRALRSLTGEKHGPYMQPWRDWWERSKDGFKMPEKPSDVLELTKPDKGVTFYGITTFSDRILFVLDVSGSMLEPAHPDAASARKEERKIDLARKELIGSLTMLDASKTFDVIFFNHKVVRFQGVMTSATPAAVERTRRFATELEPTGGTNIHDALEAAFAMAGAGPSLTGTITPAVDTIFFMTDGTPTAGKMQFPEQILDTVRGWNRTVNITIHAIAMGDSCDLPFLEALAAQNSGQFVKR